MIDMTVWMDLVDENMETVQDKITNLEKQLNLMIQKNILQDVRFNETDHTLKRHDGNQDHFFGEIKSLKEQVEGIYKSIHGIGGEKSEFVERTNPRADQLARGGNITDSKPPSWEYDYNKLAWQKKKPSEPSASHTDLDCDDCKHKKDGEDWCFDDVGNCMNFEKFEPKEKEPTDAEILAEIVPKQVSLYYDPRTHIPVEKAALVDLFANLDGLKIPYNIILHVLNPFKDKYLKED